MSNQNLSDRLEVSLSDLLPSNRNVRLVVLPGSLAPQPISCRLHAALQNAANEMGVPLHTVLSQLRDEIDLESRA